MSTFTQMLFSAISGPTLNVFRTQCGKPADTQHQVLTNLVRLNATSAYGKAHGFATIGSYEAYRDQVPINSYADLKPYIDASMNGEPSQLTVENPVLFASTSGTTGKPKYIPVTPTSKATKSKLMRVWLSGLFQDHPGMYSGQILTVVSPEIEGYSPGGIPFGAESGHGYRAMPKVVKTMYAVPYDVFEIKDYEAKYYTLLRMGAAASISFMFSVNPSTILLMAERLGRYTEPIIRDVRDGTLSQDFKIEPEIRAHVEHRLKPNPARAHFLEQAASAKGGRLSPDLVWPDLAAVGTWKGGNVGMYVDRFPEYFRPDMPVRDVGYYASEVRGSAPLSDRHSTGVLAIPTNFYEFYPVEAEAKPGPKDLLTVDDLEAGKRYFIYVTTDAGLYRYDMNDIIEVTDFYHNTPLIRFVQKGKGVVSFTGEKLYEAQVLTSVAEAFKDFDKPYEFIAAIGEVIEGTPRYAFLVEFVEAPGAEQAGALLRRVEAVMREENIEYASKRDSYRILPPVLRAIRSGEFEKYRMREVAKGRKDGQFKIVRLTTDVSFGQEFEAVADFALETPLSTN